MDSPTVWNIDDKSNSLSVDSDGLKVVYTGEISYIIWIFICILVQYFKGVGYTTKHVIYVICNFF